MANLLKTLSFIRQSLQAGIPCMLLQVVESRGSSPGRGGFCMGVNLRAEMAGSIGGGMMEHKLVETAKEFLRKTEEKTLVLPQVHSKDAARHQSGMICSGEQTVLIYQLRPSDIDTIETLITCEKTHQPCSFVIRPDGISLNVPAHLETNWHYQDENNWEFRGIAGKKPRLHIVGGGHCSLALSRLMKFLDFRVCLYENRPAINTLTENTFADEIRILGNYSELGNHLGNCSGDFVVIMTFGYRTDDQAIRSIKELPFRWLGMLGSRNKIAKMMDDYRKEGFPESWLNKISAPVGIAIKSQTPEEIAVSIAAEIIGLRNCDL